MGRKRYTPEQIIRLLRQPEVLSSEGRNVPEICREMGVTVNTYYRWSVLPSFCQAGFKLDN